jgi:hypothetical protein
MIPVFLILTVLAFQANLMFGQTEDAPDGPTTNPANGTGPDQHKAPQSAVHDSAESPATCGITHPGQCLKDLGHDQAGIWTSPLRIKPRDAFWLVPFAAATGVALHYDAQAQQELGIDNTRIDISNTISDVGLYGSMGGAGGLYVLGLASHNRHLAETGRLGEEAIADGLLVVEALKLASNRERPDEGNGRGGFWPHGTRSYEADGSFSSGHAIATWAFAEVVASEYPSKPVQFGAYAFALAISTSRVTARRHFPSDVLVGSTFGYLIGRYVVHHHADSYKASAFAVSPLMQASTRTFGVQLELTPSHLSLSRVGRLLGRE